MYSVIVIGLGSMGKRRIRLLKQIDAQITIYGVDNNEERCKEVADEMNIKTYVNLKDAYASAKVVPIAAVISTAPLSHALLITECLNYGLHIFTELNLVTDRYEQNVKLANEKGLNLFLSSTFLYRDEIKYIRRKVSEKGLKINYTYHVGQYLPDWHPWENYKNFFVGDKRTNGCREIFAIELPWIQKVFGKIVTVKIMKEKCSELSIDYPDTYHLLIEHSTGTIGSLQVDVVSRKAVRNLEIYGENIYLQWNGSPTGLFDYDFRSKELKQILLTEKIEHIDGYSSFVVENAYKNELQAFIDQIFNNKASEYTFEEDKETLELIDEIEASI